MSLVKMMPKPVRRIAKLMIERSGVAFQTISPSLDSCMSRRKDVDVATVIDVGASDGRWSLEMMKYFPNARYFLIEALEHFHGEGLRRFKTEHSNVDFVICAAGDHEGEAFFQEGADPFGGAASNEPFPLKNSRVPMSTIDNLIRARNLPPPYLLKLDTHGFEGPILDGASQVVAQASMLIIEAYNFTLRPGSMRFHELCALVEQKGFRCADMLDLMIRPANDVLWQMDIVFLPQSHPVFKSNAYRPEFEAYSKY